MKNRMNNTLYTNPMLRPHINAFFAFIEQYIAPRLNRRDFTEYVSEEVTFREIELIDNISDADVICDKTFDDELVIALLVDGSILVDGGYPLSNFSEMIDFMPIITSEGILGKLTIGEKNDEIAYIYRTDFETLKLQETIDSMNAFLENPHTGRPVFPFVTIDYPELVQEE